MTEGASRRGPEGCAQAAGAPANLVNGGLFPPARRALGSASSPSGGCILYGDRLPESFRDEPQDVIQVLQNSEHDRGNVWIGADLRRESRGLAECIGTLMRCHCRPRTGVC